MAAAQPGRVPGGFNISGLELNPEHLPGRLDTDFVAPDAREIEYYRNAGARFIRLPFLWERLEPAPGAAFDADYAGMIDHAIDACTGMSVVLDAHQFGRRHVDGVPVIIGQSAAATSAAFAQFWGRLAARYANHPTLVFNLVNEPHDQDTATLVATQNQAIAAIRRVGAGQFILASGNAWSGAHSWIESGNAASMLSIADPASKFGFDVHQYLDADASGTHAACAPQAPAGLSAFAGWARTHGRRGFLGEFGAGAGGACIEAIHALLTSADAQADLWLGWTYWAGGTWWPESYPLLARPQSLDHPVDRAQVRVLRSFLA